MKAVNLVSLAKESSLAQTLQGRGLNVSSLKSISDELHHLLLEAEHGEQVESKLLEWNIAPTRVVVVCPQPSGLPLGCFWIASELFGSEKGPAILRAWLSDTKDDPVQSLLAQISHDMRSPLSVISTAASLIARTAQENPKVARYLALIRDSSTVLRSLVEDILDYSKIQQGELGLVPVSFHLIQLLDSVIESFQLLVSNPQELTVSFKPGPDLPEMVHGDPGRLRQILTNLMANAMKFTQTGSITLTARRQGPKIRFEIIDTGTGIREEALERIFLPYQQAETTTHAAFGGTGLGLTICQILAQRMSGTIGVKSLLGEGSTFWFTAALPILEAEKPQAIPELKGRKIFIGSPNPGPFSASLAAQNSLFVQRKAEDVEEQLSRYRFDLYIIDLQVGDFDLAARTVKNYPQSKVVVISSSGQRGDVEKCREIGVVGYLTTPVAPQEVEVALGLALEAEPGSIVTKYTAKELLAAHSTFAKPT